MKKNGNLPSLGFIGTGAINSALVKGFCRSDAPAYPIFVSPQYQEKAAELQALFPERVTVAGSIQEVADSSDWLFVAVLPQAAAEVYGKTQFRPDHKVINLIPQCSFAQIKDWIGATDILAHIIPLVFVADVRGPIVLCPPLERVEALLRPLGDIVAVESRREAAWLQDITGLEAAFFTLLDDIAAWATAQGLDTELARSYTASFFTALAALGQAVSVKRLHELADEFTPGGLNELAKAYLSSTGALGHWTKALEKIAVRNPAPL
jgi:pyrroline-5-carboxylate reductase